jgi:hypothetical protein
MIRLHVLGTARLHRCTAAPLHRDDTTVRPARCGPMSAMTGRQGLTGVS